MFRCELRKHGNGRRLCSRCATSDGHLKIATPRFCVVRDLNRVYVGSSAWVVELTSRRICHRVRTEGVSSNPHVDIEWKASRTQVVVGGCV